MRRDRRSSGDPPRMHPRETHQGGGGHPPDHPDQDPHRGRHLHQSTGGRPAHAAPSLLRGPGGHRLNPRGHPLVRLRIHRRPPGEGRPEADDVTLVNTPPQEMTVALLAKGIDAFSGWDPFPTMALKGVPGSSEVIRGGSEISRPRKVIGGASPPGSLLLRSAVDRPTLTSNIRASVSLRRISCPVSYRRLLLLSRGLRRPAGGAHLGRCRARA